MCVVAGYGWLGRRFKFYPGCRCRNRQMAPFEHSRLNSPSVGSGVMGSSGAPRRDGLPAARLSIGAGMLLAVLLTSAPAQAQDILPLLEPDEKILGTNELSPPVWMAVISNGEETRFLASRGEPLFREGEARPIGGRGGFNRAFVDDRQIMLEADRIHVRQVVADNLLAVLVDLEPACG